MPLALGHICISNMKAIYFTVSKYMINAKVGVGDGGLELNVRLAVHFISFPNII